MCFLPLRVYRQTPAKHKPNARNVFLPLHYVFGAGRSPTRNARLTRSTSSGRAFACM
jgi:hypothetical protein